MLHFVAYIINYGIDLHIKLKPGDLESISNREGENPMKFFGFIRLALAGALMSVFLPPSAVLAQGDDQLAALEWRAIGPFNGGRGTSVVGHPTDPFVFWFGHSSGGLWKTEDAVTYWDPVGEGQ